jgi:recombination protein RecA
MLYGQGMSRTGELLDLALQQGFIEKKGSWFAYNTVQLGQGREQAKAFLQASSEVTSAIEVQVRQSLGLVIPRHFAQK